MKKQSSSIESALARIEQPPWSAIYRLGIGFLVLPFYTLCLGRDGSFRSLGLFFLGVLVALKLVPAISRRVLPFTGETQALWTQQRQLTKLYDSYQWQKLFWIGLGMASFMALSADRGLPRVALASACLVTGGCGLAVWWGRRRSAIKLPSAGNERPTPKTIIP